MGRIICPDGKSVMTNQFVSSMPYEYLVRDLKDEHFTPSYRAKCIICISEVGIYGSFPDLLPYIANLADKADDSNLKEVANYCLRKLSVSFPRRNSLSRYEDWVG